MITRYFHPITDLPRKARDINPTLCQHWQRRLCYPRYPGTQQTRDVEPLLVWCWANVTDLGPTLNRLGIACLLSVLCMKVIGNIMRRDSVGYDVYSNCWMLGYVWTSDIHLIQLWSNVNCQYRWIHSGVVILVIYFVSHWPLTVVLVMTHKYCQREDKY